MIRDVVTIRLMLPLRVNSVNCFLIRSDVGWVLVDTACPSNRAELMRRMKSAGCEQGKLTLILLTHGDFDHCGNARHLRDRHRSRIAMHPGDLGMVDRGDMFWNRGNGNSMVRTGAPVFFGFRRSDWFVPDIEVGDGQDLSEYGLDARVIHLPGHSQGSVGVLTNTGELFCGDLLINEKGPVLNYRISDPGAAQASVEKLRSLSVREVIPSHGKPFRMDELG